MKILYLATVAGGEAAARRASGRGGRGGHGRRGTRRGEWPQRRAGRRAPEWGARRAGRARPRQGAGVGRGEHGRGELPARGAALAAAGRWRGVTESVREEKEGERRTLGQFIF
jgi:hypothetical protein